MWVEDLISAGNVVHMPETQELFLLPLIYDVMSRCYGKFAQLWAFMAYALIILAGFISIVSIAIIARSRVTCNRVPPFVISQGSKARTRTKDSNDN